MNELELASQIVRLGGTLKRVCFGWSCAAFKSEQAAIEFRHWASSRGFETRNPVVERRGYGVHFR